MHAVGWESLCCTWYIVCVLICHVYDCLWMTSVVMILGKTPLCTCTCMNPRNHCQFHCSWASFLRQQSRYFTSVPCFRHNGIHLWCSYSFWNVNRYILRAFASGVPCTVEYIIHMNNMICTTSMNILNTRCNYIVLFYVCLYVVIVHICTCLSIIRPAVVISLKSYYTCTVTVMCAYKIRARIQMVVTRP